MALLYKNIQGWFDYEDFYDFVINQFNSGTFVEIGTWKGRSTVYMAEKIKESHKNIKFFAIDTFKGTPNEPAMQNKGEINNLYKEYLKNIVPVKRIITTLIGESSELYKRFADKSINFLFIDGDHRYSSVKSDIQLWLPKMKSEGIISGHDYMDSLNCGVKKAVDEVFTEVKIMGQVWFTIV